MLHPPAQAHPAVLVLSICCGCVCCQQALHHSGMPLRSCQLHIEECRGREEGMHVGRLAGRQDCCADTTTEGWALGKQEQQQSTLN